MKLADFDEFELVTWFNSQTLVLQWSTSVDCEANYSEIPYQPLSQFTVNPVGPTDPIQFKKPHQNAPLI